MLRKLLNKLIKIKPKIECIYVKDGIIKINLETREYQYVKCSNNVERG